MSFPSSPDLVSVFDQPCDTDSYSVRLIVRGILNIAYIIWKRCGNGNLGRIPVSSNKLLDFLGRDLLKTLSGETPDQQICDADHTEDRLRLRCESGKPTLSDECEVGRLAFIFPSELRNSDREQLRKLIELTSMRIPLPRTRFVIHGIESENVHLLLFIVIFEHGERRIIHALVASKQDHAPFSLLSVSNANMQRTIA